MKKIMTLEQGIKELQQPYPLEKDEWLEIAEYPIHGVQVLLQRRIGLPGSLDLNDYGENVVLREYETSEDAKRYEDECKKNIEKKGYSYENKKRAN